jgi:hypothetical protein
MARRDVLPGLRIPDRVTGSDRSVRALEPFGLAATFKPLILGIRKCH